MKARKNPFLLAAASTAVTFALCFLPGSLLADNTWDGGGADANWTTNANWGLDTAPSFGTLTFSGSARTTNTINAGYNMNGLNYTGASAWTLNNSGGSILSLFDNGGVQAKIENNTSGALVTINAPVLFAATTGTARGEINAISGNLTFGSAGTIGITGSGVAGLEFFGNGNTVTMGGIITGTGKYLALKGTGANTAGNTVILNASNSYTGDTLIDTGTLVGGNSSAFGTVGTIYVGNGSNTFGNTGASILLSTGGVNISRNIVTNKADNGGSAGTGTRTIGGSNTAGTTTYSGNVFLNGGAVLTSASGGTTTFSGIIQNGTDTGVVSRAVTVNGAGTVILSGANTFTGGFTLSGGAVRAAATSTATGGNVTAGAFGAGPITINGGTIFSTGVDIAANNISIGGDFAINSGTNALNGRVGLSGAINLGNDTRTVTLGRSGTFAGTGTSGFESLRFNAVGNGPAAAVSNGTLRLVGDSSTNGTTSVVSASFQTATNFTGNAGLTIGSNVVMRIGGTSPGTGTNAVTLTVESGGYFNLSDGTSVSRSLTTAGLNGAGNITNLSTVLGTGALTVGDNNTTGSFSGIIADGSTFNATTGITALGLVSLTKTGTGTQTLSGANNYSGATSVSAGVLNIQHATALGNTTGSTSVSSGAALQIQGGITVGAEALSLNGTGISATGALRNISGDNVWQGTVTLAGASRINSDADSLTFNTAVNSITGTQNLTIGGAGNTTVGGTITTSTGTLTKDGAGTLTLSGSNTYSGLTTLGAGTIVANNTQALGTGALSITSGATAPILDLQTYGTATNTTITGTANASILVNAASSTPTASYTLGTLAMPAATLAVSRGSNVTTTGNLTFGTTTLSASTAVFDTGSGINLTLGAVGGAFNLTKQGAGTLTLNTTGTRSTNAGGTTLAAGTLRIGAANALNTATTTPVLNLNGGTLSLGLDTGAQIGGAGSVVVNVGTATIEVDRATAGVGVTDSVNQISLGTQTLNVTAGSNVTSGVAGLNLTTATGALTLAADGGILNVGTGVAVTSTGSIAGNFNFTKQGAGSLTFNVGSSRSSGQTNLTAGTLKLGSASGLGTSATTLALNGGTLDLAIDSSTNAYGTTVGGNVTIQSNKATAASTGITHTLGVLSIGANTLTVAAGANVGSGTAGLTFGATTLTGNATFNVTNGATASTTLTLNGVVSGSGFGVTKEGSGTLSFAGANTFNGGLIVNGGTIRSSGNPTGGSGIITAGQFGTSTLTMAGGTGITWASQLTIANTQTILNGNITLGAGSTQRLTWDAGAFVLGGNARTITVAATDTLANAVNVLGSSTVNAVRWNTGVPAVPLSLDSGSTLRWASSGTGSSWSGLGLLDNVTFNGNSTLAIGSNVLMTFNNTNRLTNVTGTARLNVEQGGIVSLSNQTTSQSQTIYSLSDGGGIGGIVTNLATAGTTATLTISNGDSKTFSGTITDGAGAGTGLSGINGVVAVIKSGTGTQTFSGVNTYTGATDILGGKLVVNGNISTSSLTTVAVGATLAGGGTVGKTIVNGTLAVGTSPGTMNFADTLGLNGTTIMEIDGTAGAGVTDGHDFANLTGSGAAGVLTYGGTMTLDMGVIFGIGNYSWNLFDMASETGTFSTITLADQYSGSLLDGDLDGVWDLTSGDNTWQFTESTGVLGLTVIPEPRAALLGGLGILALLRRRRA